MSSAERAGRCTTHQPSRIPECDEPAAEDNQGAYWKGWKELLPEMLKRSYSLIGGDPCYVKHVIHCIGLVCEQKSKTLWVTVRLAINLRTTSRRKSCSLMTSPAGHGRSSAWTYSAILKITSNLLIMDHFSEFWETELLPDLHQDILNHMERLKQPSRLIRTFYANPCMTELTLEILHWRNTPTEYIDSSHAQMLMLQRLKTSLPVTNKLLEPCFVTGVVEQLHDWKQFGAVQNPNLTGQLVICQSWT